MKIFKKHENRLPTPDKVKRGYRYYCFLVAAVALMGCCTMTAFAAPTGGDPLTVIHNLSDFIFGLIRAVGLILLGWGIVQVGLSLQSHDPSQRSNGFPDPGGRCYHHFCQGDFDPYHWLISQSYPNTWGRLTGWACPLKRRCFACRIIG